MGVPFLNPARRLSLYLYLYATKPPRTVQTVVVDFREIVDSREIGIALPGYNAVFLSHYPAEKYDALKARLKLFKASENFDEVLVDSHYGIGRIEYAELEDQFLRAQIVGNVLDLRDITQKYFDYYSEREGASSYTEDVQMLLPFMAVQVPITDRILDAISEAQKEFEKIVADPSATEDAVFSALDDAKDQLGIENVVIYRPLGEGKWVCTQRTRQWSDSPSIYAVEGEGAKPATTLASILAAHEKVMVVDFDDPAGLSGAGIVADPAFFPDRTLAKGSGKAVIVKMYDSFNELLAVVLLHNRVKTDEELEPGPILPEDTSGARRVLTALRLYFSEAASAIERVTDRTQPLQARIAEDSSTGRGAHSILLPTVSRLLTDDLRFNPTSGEFPRTPAEYHEMMQKILGANGVFPGDTEPLSPDGTFTRRGAAGVSRGPLRRRGYEFFTEVFAPHLLARGTMNRFIFDTDLLTKEASAIYGTPDVTYDRKHYYEGRLFHSDLVPIVRYQGWPIAFSAMQGYRASFEDRELYYTFIHFVMTHGLFQKYGLTSWSIRDGMSTLFFRDIMRHEPNLIYDSKGRLTDTRWTMWALAHSGRFTPFYSFVKSFADVPTSWGPLPEAIIADVHRKITPSEEIAQRGMPLYQGIMRVNGGCFPIGRDPGVYEPRTRYAVEGGEVQFPADEENLSPVIRQAWLNAIGGEQGVADGNSLYFGGLVNVWRIVQAMRRERTKEMAGLGGLLEGGAEKALQGAVKRMR